MRIHPVHLDLVLVVNDTVVTFVQLDDESSISLSVSG